MIAVTELTETKKSHERHTWKNASKSLAALLGHGGADSLIWFRDRNCSRRPGHKNVRRICQNVVQWKNRKQWVSDDNGGNSTHHRSFSILTCDPKTHARKCRQQQQ